MILKGKTKNQLEKIKNRLERKNPWSIKLGYIKNLLKKFDGIRRKK